MNELIETVIDIIDRVNQTSNEIALMHYFHENMTDTLVKANAAEGIGTTILFHGIFVTEQNGKRDIIKQGIFYSEWPNISVRMAPDNSLLHLGILLLREDLEMANPGVILRSALVRAEVNDGDDIGYAPWNLAPAMPQRLKDAGFDGGWQGHGIIRFKQ